jgi:hypothetical protein
MAAAQASFPPSSAAQATPRTTAPAPVHSMQVMTSGPGIAARSSPARTTAKGCIDWPPRTHYFAADWAFAPAVLAVGRGICSGVVLDLSSLDLEEIGNALADQTDYEHRWLINPQTGEIAFWTADTGIDGQAPVDLDDLDLVCIDPLPSWVWYQDMADFAEAITDERAGRRLARAIQGQRRLSPRQGRAPR